MSGLRTPRTIQARRVRLSRRLVVPCSIAALLASTVSVRPAGAFPLDTNECGVGTGLQQFQYSLSSDWNHAAPEGGTYRTATYDGIREWNGVDDHDGSALVHLVENPTAPAGTAIFLDWSTFGAGTLAVSCNGGPITYFNDLFVNGLFATNPHLIRQVARHEYGHWLALDHTGQLDAVPFDRSVQATMIPASDGTEVLSGDDAGQLMSIWSSNTERRANPNFGFSQNSHYWLKSAATSWKFIGTGGSPGEYAIVQATGSDYMAQDINVAPKAGHDFDATPAGHFKLTTPGDSGVVVVDVLKREVTYGGPDSRFQSGHNQNTRPAVGSWISCGGMKVSPTNSWAYYSGTACSVSGWEGADVHLRLLPAGILDSGGNSTYLSVDSLRVNLTLH
jgi:hypothetical protein